MSDKLMGGGFLMAEDENEPTAGGFDIENEDSNPIAGGCLLWVTGEGGFPWLVVVGMGPLDVNLLGVEVFGLLEPARARTASAPRGGS
jgi:hypothetical protein